MVTNVYKWMTIHPVMVNQVEVVLAYNWGMEQLSKGRDPTRTLEQWHDPQAGREALRLIKEWEATPEAQYQLRKVEEAKVRASELGFSNITEYSQVQQLAGRPTQPNIPERKPIYRDGKLIGYEDPVARMSYAVEKQATPQFDFQQRAADIAATKTSEKKSFLSKATSYALGSPYIPIFSIAVPKTAGTTKGFTIKEVKRGVSEFGWIPSGVSKLIPETRIGLVGTTAFVGAFSYIPPVAQYGTSAGIAGYSGKTIIDPTKPKEEKLAAGIVGGFAGFGAVAGAKPYISGIKAKISPKYSPVKTQLKGFKAIELKETPIGLIPRGSPLKTGETIQVKLPKTSPLKRGGFEVKPYEKKKFLGKQVLTTSQQSFFREGKDIKLEREFFVTPQEPTLKIPETRVSRLGLENPFKFQKDAQLGFGLPKQPQIGIMREGIVSRVETPKTFRIGTGTELEAIKGYGTIKGVKKVGVTTIKGQSVGLYEFRVGRGFGKTIKVKKIKTTEVTKRVSGEAAISTSLKVVKVKTKAITQKTKPLSPTSTYIKVTKKPTAILPPTTTIKFPPTTTGVSPSITPSRIPPTITTPPTTTITPPRKPPVYPPKIDFKFKTYLVKTKPQLRPQPKKYQASLRSKAFGIRAAKISGAYKIGAGGIIARPIITRRK